MNKANFSPHNPWKIFPATKTLAYYHPAAQFIELSEIDSTRLQQALSGRDPKDCVAVLPLLFHELRHWIDHAATVWGRKRLVGLFDAIHARHANDPNDFYRIVDYRRLQDRDYFAEYFSTVEHTSRPTHAVDQWLYQHTCGMRFDLAGHLDKTSPIFFTSYRWSTGESACRVPFSATSLLESSAMHFELAIHNLFASQLAHGERQVEETQIESLWRQSLYTPALGKYSTAAHLIANRLALSAANEAYPLASALASVCLNISDDVFDRLSVPKDFEMWGERNIAAIKGRDRGYAYLAIAFHAINEYTDNPRLWVDAAVQAAGLPPVDELELTARQELDVISTTAMDGPFSKRLTEIVAAGNDIFDAVGIVPTIDGTLKALGDLKMPPIVCSDCNWHRFGKPWLINDPTETDAWWDQWSTKEQQFTEFMKACGI